MKYIFIFLIFVVLSCKQDEIFFSDVQQHIEWDSIPMLSRTDSGEQLIRKILIPILDCKLNKEIPTSVFLAYAMYHTEDGTKYYPETNNPFGIKCLETRKCKGNHCVGVDGEKIRKFSAPQFAVQFQANILQRTYNKKNKNGIEYLEGILNSKKLVIETNFNISKICSYYKTYNLIQYDKYRK